jgi:transcriptional regulator with XRE-family HTH domain
METLIEQFRYALRVELARQNMTMSQLAERMSVTPSALSHKLKRDMRLSSVDAISKALGVPLLRRAD